MSERKLEKLRKKMDDIDSKLISLMADRLDVGGHIGKVKRGMGKEVRDEQRREDVLHHAEEFAKERNLDPIWVSEMMQKLMDESEKVQEKNIPIVAIQGNEERTAKPLLANCCRKRPLFFLVKHSWMYSMC